MHHYTCYTTLDKTIMDLHVHVLQYFFRIEEVDLLKATLYRLFCAFISDFIAYLTRQHGKINNNNIIIMALGTSAKCQSNSKMIILATSNSWLVYMKLHTYSPEQGAYRVFDSPLMITLPHIHKRRSIVIRGWSSDYCRIRIQSLELNPLHIQYIHDQCRLPQR